MAGNISENDYTISLYPALFQCFTIILCGYIAGVFKLVSQNESKGIGTFVGTFALPSLIFLSLARLDFSIVNWRFLFAILIAKGIVFGSVIIVTLLITKPANLGRAGIFAIFCTQSNDFALGYPIVNAIYSTTHPEYALYLYLMAPISLAILNPMAFVLMEIHKQKTIEGSESLTEADRSTNISKLKLLKQIAIGIVFNPVLVMTILGIAGDFVFNHKLSVYLEGLLEVFGQSFSATALFLLGLRMVGQVHRLRGPALLLPCVLIMLKLIVLPVIMRESVTMLQAGANDTDTLSLSTYAFIYGTIPTAPAVFVFSNLYRLELDLVASSMVICTLLSAPMMFMSAQIITISKDVADQIKRFGFNLSIASLISVMWVMLLFVLTKKYKRIPHRLTLCLMMSQMFLAISVIWGGPYVSYVHSWSVLLQQSLRIFSMYSCLLWTSMLSIGVLMLESRGPCFVVAIWPVLAFIAWGTPALMLIILLLTRDSLGDINAKAADAIRLCLLFFCLTVSTGCLIIHMRVRRSLASNVGDEAQSVQPEESMNLVDNEETDVLANGNGYGTIGETECSINSQECCTNDPSCTNNIATTDMEDIGGRELNQNSCPHSPSVCPTHMNGCSYFASLERAASSIGLIPSEQSRGRGRQMLKHTVLIIVYSLAMFIGIAYTTWRMMRNDESGIFLEIEFFDVAANYGQGLVMLLLFGLNPDEFLIPFLKMVKSKWSGSEKVLLPPVENLTFETKQVCDQFIVHHLDRCKQAIAKDQRWRMRTYKDAFRGSCLVRWLVSCGLAKDDLEAVQYGRHLLDGRLIEHINNAHHFTNSPLIYCFK